MFNKRKRCSNTYIEVTVDSQNICKDKFHKIPTEPYWELYDLKKDPNEMNNVYDNPEYLEIVKKLKEDLLKLKEETGDTDEKYPELIEVRENYWN